MMSKKVKEEISDERTQQKPLRLWPGVVAVILQLLLRFVVPLVAPEALQLIVFGQTFLGLCIFVWWAFFSRAARLERWIGIVLMVVALVAIRPLLHESIRTAGLGFWFPVLAIPTTSIVFIVWAVLTRHLSQRLRRVTMIAAILLAYGAWALIQTGGVDAYLNHDISWRWAKTPEESLLARTGEDQAALLSAEEAADTKAEWPGFRGPNRDGIILGVKIETDWSASPPVELWRRPVGPGWSSFAVHGNLFYTQEQRGDDEVVSCYKVTTGKPVWKHRDETRFYESNGGAGPRGTPALSGSRVYTFGATGILNVLDAGDGSVVWSCSPAEDTKTKVPIWGFSSSPLVLDDVVIVAVAGSLIAYDLATGKPHWSKPDSSKECYSSPHLFNIDGITQVLLQKVAGTLSVTPADGNMLWEHAWPGCPIVQPALTADGDILISVDEKNGIRRIAVAQGPDGWTTKERWTSNRIKPYFNDSVIHKGHVYGFDGRSLSCIDIKDGTRKWKGGRYGRGQFVLLADQDLLLVISEKGELALVNAVPDQFTELTRFPAIKGKTWNHPVLVGDILLVRNAAEMAAFRLNLVSS